MAYLKDKLHLACCTTVHLCLFQHLVELGVRCLSNVEDAPCQCYTQIKVSYAIFLVKFETWLTFNRNKFSDELV